MKQKPTLKIGLKNNSTGNSKEFTFPNVSNLPDTTAISQFGTAFNTAKGTNTQFQYGAYNFDSVVAGTV